MSTLWALRTPSWIILLITSSLKY